MSVDVDKIPELDWKAETIQVPKNVKTATHTLTDMELEYAVKNWARLQYGLDWKKDKIEVLLIDAKATVTVTRDA